MKSPSKTRNANRGSRYIPLVIIFTILILSLIAWNPVSSTALKVPVSTPTPSSTLLAGEATDFSPEILANRDQTNGIVIGGITMVLIIVGGTLSFISEKKRE